MQKSRKWIYCLTILILVVSACTTLRIADTGTTMLGEEISQVIALPNSPTPEKIETVQLKANECLDCHSSKDLLVETADPVEEIAESESKGVG